MGIKALNIVEFALQENIKTTIMETVTQAFKQYKVINESSNSLKFQILKTANGTPITFGGLFRFSEQLKEQRLIVDYSVCETTFEDIFQYFAKKNSLQAEEETLLSLNNNH
jgi:hypothetical protein